MSAFAATVKLQTLQCAQTLQDELESVRNNIKAACETSVFYRYGAEVFWVLTCGSSWIPTGHFEGSSGQHHFDPCGPLSSRSLYRHHLADEMLKHTARHHGTCESSEMTSLL